MKIFFLTLLTVGYCKGRPFLIRKPANQVANVGDTVELRCIVGGQRMVEYVNKAVQWVDQTRGQTINTFAGGRNINKKYNERYEIVGDESLGDWTLRINNLAESDSGNYQCQVHHGHGQASAKVLVRVPPKKILISGTDSEGNLAHVPGQSGNENIECRVYHDALVDQQFLAVSTRSYPMSEPRASIARLENAKFGNDQAQDGEIVSYRCATTGHPAPARFYWNINGEKSEISSNEVFTTKIAKQNEDRAFKVTCQAEAEFNNRILKSNIAESSLSVLWGPVALPKSEEIEPVIVTEGAPFELKCPFDAFPMAEVAWTKNNDALEGEFSSILALNSAAAGDSGRWTCQAKNPVTGLTAEQTFEVTVLQKPVIISPEKQEIGKNASRPMIFCSFKFHFSSESFSNVRWFVQKEDDSSIEAIQLEPGSPATSAMVSDEKWMIRWTDVTSDSATSLLTILDATEEDLDAKYICQVSNDIGMTTGEFEISSGLANATLAIISGAVLVLALICVAIILMKCNREKKHVTKERNGKLTPDLIQHTVPSMPPALDYQLGHRQDAEIHISDADLHQGPTRSWIHKPDSTCSGPDDGYSTERGESSKAGSGSKLPNVIPSAEIIEDDMRSEEFDRYEMANEHRLTSEKMYSSLQGSSRVPVFGRFSTLQNRHGHKIESTLRPSSAQPQFIPPMSESLEDLRHTMPEGSESSDDTYNNSNQPLLKNASKNASANVFLQTRPTTARSVSHV
ncbi:Oidioi.mRNA.OKI2018_I69.PAR.g12026.t1.cds [Oikopleura dioica]|uniref:Oidioi.mRNA.OKI2018_I69.PAR.g12026.t1.cds n=1 Tax=Oikopleura dioica TaxID=34765 RepID=A0ABN7RYH2_OIKDI|nr:Oidioi.mRNA.OKI2018_I69.PAR.g12026.t1.cds [Oikopleura dioica]